MNPQTPASPSLVNEPSGTFPPREQTPVADGVRRTLAVLWPAFLMAGVLEMAIFALIDPSQLHLVGGGPLGLSDLKVYSLAFLLFWIVIAIGCALALMLAAPPSRVNQRARRR